MLIMRPLFCLRSTFAPLAELPARVRAAGLGAPAVIVVGDVVRLRAELGGYEDLPLFGARVLVTRPREQAEPLVEALRAAGAEARAIPMLRIEPAGDPAAIAAALAALDDYDAVLLSSANAVRELARRAAALGVALAGRRPRFLCVGPATARAAEAAGLPVAALPEARFDAEGLFEALAALLPVAGRRFLLPRAEGGREILAERIAEAGGRADSLVLYRSAAPDLDPAALRAALAAGEFDTLSFASPSAVRHFAGLLDEGAREAARRCVVAAIGPVTAEALVEEGLAPDVVAARAEGPELVAALAEQRARTRSDPMSFPENRPRRLRRTATLRRMVRETRLSVDNLVLPLFARHGKGVREPIASMPGVARLSVDLLVEECREAHALGICGRLLLRNPRAQRPSGLGSVCRGRHRLPGHRCGEGSRPSWWS